MIHDACSLSIQVWYLDDGTVIEDSVEVNRALTLIQSKGPEMGPKLNIRMTKVFWPTVDPRISKDGLFSRDINRPRIEVKFLGGAVSMNVGFIEDFVSKRVSKFV